jgi:hypothetical protein
MPAQYLNQATTTSFQILSNLLLIIHPTIQRSIVLDIVACWSIAGQRPQDKQIYNSRY